MRLNELLGLMDADEKVQLIYPDGKADAGTAGRLFSCWERQRRFPSAQSPSGFGFGNKKAALRLASEKRHRKGIVESIAGKEGLVKW